jgi:hypothetical protein
MISIILLISTNYKIHSDVGPYSAQQSKSMAGYRNFDSISCTGEQFQVTDVRSMATDFLLAG